MRERARTDRLADLDDLLDVARRALAGNNPLYDGAVTLFDGLGELRELGFAPAGFWPVARGPAGELLEVDVVAVRC